MAIPTWRKASLAAAGLLMIGAICLVALDALDRALRCSGALEGPWPRARGTGPRAKTVRQHQLEGTKQKCRHDGYQNADPPMGGPPKAEGLSEMASAEWDRMCDRMRLAGTLATTDDAALLRDVRSFELVDRLEAQLATEPLTFLKITVDGAGQEHQEKKANPLTVDRPETSGGAAVERRPAEGR